jgi:putative transposase
VACHKVDSEYYDDMRKGEVQKGYHCAWQIYYQLVFPVKYRKALLDGKISLEKIVRIFKSITAREIFRKCPQIKKELWGGEFWSDGYYSDF